MKVRSLIKLTSAPNDRVHISLFRPSVSIPNAAATTDDAIATAKNICLDFIQTNGRSWIDFWKGDGGDLNCPEGFVKLPIDLWCCKISGEPCALQAKVPISKKHSFLKGCHASNEKKEVVFRTVTEGKYDGFHHVPGRYLCVACENDGKKKESFWYHYPWEFAELDFAIGKSYEETREILRGLNLPSNFVMCPLCASCCKSVASRINPGLQSQLEVLEFDVNFRG